MIPRNEQETKECTDAKMLELQKLKDFDTYEEIYDEGQDCISSRWVLWKKGVKLDEVRARLVACGFEEEEEIQSDSPTLSKAGFRTILATAASKNWKIETTDFKSAFLQGSAVDRTIYLKPPKEAGANGKVWKLKKALYGLKDAGCQWFFRVRTHLLDSGCVQSDLDPGLFLWKDKLGNVAGVIGLHVDDFLHCGNEEFDRVIIDNVSNTFLVGKRERGSFMYTGFSITQDAKRIFVDQNQYMASLDLPEIENNRVIEKKTALNQLEKTKLRKMAGSLNWLVRGTRPDKSFELILASTKFQNGCIEDLTRIRKILCYLKESRAELVFPNLGDPTNWKILCFTDASLGNLNEGRDSTGGHLLLLWNQLTKNCSTIDWQSNKIKRVVRSTLSAETLSLCDGLENALLIRDLLHSIWNKHRKVPIIGIVDNLSLVESVSSTTSVSDKRLRRDIGAIKEMLDSGDVSQLKWVPGDQQLADILTKQGVNDSGVLKICWEGQFNALTF